MQVRSPVPLIGSGQSQIVAYNKVQVIWEFLDVYYSTKVTILRTPVWLVGFLNIRGAAYTRARRGFLVYQRTPKTKIGPFCANLQIGFIIQVGDIADNLLNRYLNPTTFTVNNLK